MFYFLKKPTYVQVQFFSERERERERERVLFFFSRNSENIQVVDTALNRALVVCEVDLV